MGVAFAFVFLIAVTACKKSVEINDEGQATSVGKEKEPDVVTKREVLVLPKLGKLSLVLPMGGEVKGAEFSFNRLSDHRAIEMDMWQCQMDLEALIFNSMKITPVPFVRIIAGKSFQIVNGLKPC